MRADQFQSIRRLGVAVAIAVLIVCSWLAPLDSTAARQVDAGLKRSLVSFATARALDGVISAAQGTEVAIQPAGVGLVLAPGQLLDPLNDLLEQFSELMLLASIAFAMQKLLLGIGAHWLASLLLTMAAVAWVAFLLRNKAVPVVLSRLLVLLLMVRFAVPVVTIGTDVLFRQFMAADYEASQQAIDVTSQRLEKLTPAPANELPGMLDQFKSWWSQNADVKTRFEELKQAAEQAAEHLIKLMAIFLLQTLVIPVLLLWGLSGVARAALRRR